MPSKDSASGLTPDSTPTGAMPAVTLTPEEQATARAARIAAAQEKLAAAQKAAEEKAAAAQQSAAEKEAAAKKAAEEKTARIKARRVQAHEIKERLNKINAEHQEAIIAAEMAYTGSERKTSPTMYSNGGKGKKQAIEEQAAFAAEHGNPLTEDEKFALHHQAKIDIGAKARALAKERRDLRAQVKKMKAESDADTPQMPPHEPFQSDLRIEKQNIAGALEASHHQTRGAKSIRAETDRVVRQNTESVKSKAEFEAAVKALDERYAQFHVRVQELNGQIQAALQDAENKLMRDITVRERKRAFDKALQPEIDRIKWLKKAIEKCDTDPGSIAFWKKNTVIEKPDGKLITIKPQDVASFRLGRVREWQEILGELNSNRLRNLRNFITDEMLKLVKPVLSVISAERDTIRNYPNLGINTFDSDELPHQRVRAVNLRPAYQKYSKKSDDLYSHYTVFLGNMQNDPSRDKAEELIRGWYPELFEDPTVNPNA